MQNSDVPSYLVEESKDSQTQARAVYSSANQNQATDAASRIASQHSLDPNQVAKQVEESDSESEDDDDGAASDADSQKQSSASGSAPSLGSSGAGSHKTGSSHGSSSSWSKYSMSNPILAFFIKIAIWVSEQYYRRVTYKVESILSILLLLPFAALAISMIMIEKITFQSVAMGTLFKVVMIVIGLVAIWGAGVVNKRHAFLTCIALVISGQATIRTVSDTTKGNGTNLILKYFSYAFYACLLAAELSVYVTPLMMPDLSGVALSLDPEVILENLDSSNNVFAMGMGGVKTCAECATIQSRTYEIMPVGTYMERLGERGVNYIVYTHEDVLALNVHCMKLRKPAASTEGVFINTEGYEVGNNTLFAQLSLTSMDYEYYLEKEQELLNAKTNEGESSDSESVTASDETDEGELRKRGEAAAEEENKAEGGTAAEEETSSGTSGEGKNVEDRECVGADCDKMVSRSCDIKIKAKRALTTTEYSTDSIGEVKKVGILDMEPTDPETCQQVGIHCLNDPERDTLVHLAYPLLAHTSITLQNRDVIHSAVIPFPGSELNDEEYAHRMKKMILMSMMNTALILYDRPDDVQTFNLNQARILSIQPALKWITIIISIFCVLLGVALILMDLVRVQRANNILLRKLDNSIHLGKEHFEAIALVAFSASSTSHDREDWDLVPIRYGEDRKTIMDPIGRLMFGTKKDVIKMKLDRTYY